MSSQGFYLCLSTQKFFSLCNWQGQIETGQPRRLRAPDILGLGSPLGIGGRQKRAGEKEEIVWQCLSVQKFFSLCNWQGETEAGQKTPLPLAQTVWQCRSVKEFFSLCNWQGIPLENNLQHTNPSSRLKEQVTQFFQFIPWEGNPEISFLPKIASIASPFSAPETTFTDLSELF